MMTPEEFQRAQRQTRRFNQCYDSNVDQCLPADLVKTKAGKVAKRQPTFQERPVTYYKAQCSFRGLSTSGNKVTLQQLLKSRDKAKDVEIQRVLEQTEQQIRSHHQEKEQEQAEIWWNNPDRTLNEKAQIDVFRALKENLGSEVLQRSCYVFTGFCPDLQAAARECGLAYEEADAPDEFQQGQGRVYVVGQAQAVREAASKSSEKATKQRREHQAKKKAVIEAQRAAFLAKKKAMLEEARKMSDWDVTGMWRVECHEMATYSSAKPANLGMKIFRDSFDLTDPRLCDDHDSRNEYCDESRAEEDEEDEEDGEDNEDGPAKDSGPRTSKNLPRFCAEFDFGDLEGLLRIFPRDTTLDESKFKVKDHPTFDFIWRGRETGEGQIQLGAEEKTHEITFSNAGTSFKGTFSCPFIHGELTIKGSKVAHGHGQEKSSAYEWNGLSEDAWNEESVSRWH